MPFATCSSAVIAAEGTAVFAVCGRSVDAESAEDVVSETSSFLGASELRARGETFSGSDLSGNGVVLADDLETTGVRSLSSDAGASYTDLAFCGAGDS